MLASSMTRIPSHVWEGSFGLKNWARTHFKRTGAAVVGMDSFGSLVVALVWVEGAEFGSVGCVGSFLVVAGVGGTKVCCGIDGTKELGMGLGE